MNNYQKAVIVFLLFFTFVNTYASVNLYSKSIFIKENPIEIAFDQENISFNDLYNQKYRTSELLYEDLRILDNISIDTCYDLLIDDNYLYTTGGDFNIFNITNPRNISNLGIFEDSHVINEIFINDSLAYIGRGNFSILDIANKSHPVEIGSYEKDNPHIRDIEIVGDFAYVLDSYDGLIILNISDPANPHEVRTLWGLGGTVRDIFIQGDYAFIAEALYGLWILDISNPNFPSAVSRTPTGGNAREVRIKGDYAFLSNWDSPEDLAVFDIGNRFNPISVVNISIPHNVSDFTIEGNYLYLVNSFGEIYIYDINNPENIIEIISWKLYLSGGFWSIDVDRGFMIIATEGFYIIDHDIDDDTIFSYDEYLIGSDPFNIDSDMDLMPDNWERDYGLNLTKNDAQEDLDTDGLSNLEEYQQGKNPTIDDIQPVIHSITQVPILVTYQDEVTIQINTSDHNGINNVTLEWNNSTNIILDDCTWNETLRLFEGWIPAHPRGRITYLVHSYDTRGNGISSLSKSYDIIPIETTQTTTTSITNITTKTETRTTSGLLFSITIIGLMLKRRKISY